MENIPHSQVYINPSIPPIPTQTRKFKKIIFISIAVFILIGVGFGGFYFYKLKLTTKQIPNPPIKKTDSQGTSKEDNLTETIAIPDLSQCYSIVSSGLFPDNIENYWRVSMSRSGGLREAGSSDTSPGDISLPFTQYTETSRTSSEFTQGYGMNVIYADKENVWNVWWGQALPTFSIESIQVDSDVQDWKDLVTILKDYPESKPKIGKQSLEKISAPGIKVSKENYGGVPSLVIFTESLSEEEKRPYSSVIKIYMLFEPSKTLVTWQIPSENNTSFEVVKQKAEILIADWAKQICMLNQSSKRDQKRKEDLAKITDALEQYHKEKNNYPFNDFRAGRIVDRKYEPIEPEYGLSDSPLSTLLIKYLITIPQDPGQFGWYGYYGGGDKYELIAFLEDQTNSDCVVENSRCVFRIQNGSVVTKR